MEDIYDHNPTPEELDELGLDTGSISRLTQDDTITMIVYLYSMRRDSAMCDKYINMLSEEERWRRFPPEDCLDSLD